MRLCKWYIFWGLFFVYVNKFYYIKHDNSMEKFKAFERKKIKLSKRDSWYIFFIVILSVLLVITSFLLYSNSFYKSRFNNLGQVELGTPVMLYLENSGAFVQVVSFAGTILPDMNITQQCSLQIGANSIPLVARAKVVINKDAYSQYEEIEGTFTSDFVKNNADGFYYCNSVLNPNLVVKFLQSIKIPGDKFDINSQEIYNFVVLVETLPYDSDYTTIWQTENFIVDKV